MIIQKQKSLLLKKFADSVRLKVSQQMSITSEKGGSGKPGFGTQNTMDSQMSPKPDKKSLLFSQWSEKINLGNL